LSWRDSLLSFGGFLAITVWTTEAFTAPLRPIDVSILWPLKSAAVADGKQDAIFGQKGDGFCNAPRIDDWQYISQETFAEVERQVFNKEGEVCGRDKALEDEFFLVDDPDLMNGKVHLARLKGIHPFACNQKNWRVSAVRVDPCVNSRSVATEPDKCMSEFRVIAQIFEKNDTNIWAVRDFTLHLIYEIPDMAALVADLKKFAEVSKYSEARLKWEAGYDDGMTLRPHHGLRNEMDSCGGPVTKAMQNLLKKYASPAKLTQLAWMSSSMGVKEWTFGAFDVKEYGTKLEAQVINGQLFDNFSDVLMMGEKSPLNQEFAGGRFGSIYDEITLATRNALPTNENNPEARGRHYQRLINLQNPKLTGQADAIGCTSCHLAPQTLDRLNAMYGSAQYDGESYTAKRWPGFFKEKRSFVHLRNFGYGPQFSLAINPRTINETDYIVKFFAKNFP
jgi:hypothetical protein